MARATAATKGVLVHITPPNLVTRGVHIVGTSCFVQHRFSAKAQAKIVHTQEEGSANPKKDAPKEPKNLHQLYLDATYRTAEGWCGIPASAFRNAMVSACRLVRGYTMSRAKIAVFIVADGYDAEDDTPLVRITKGEPSQDVRPARNANGSCDIRSRPMWEPGWEANVQVRFDADQFKEEDVANLLNRAGQQVGVGEGRADSPNSCGMMWGFFEVPPTGEVE